MEQLIFLVVVGALALGKWLLENAGSFQKDESNDIPEAPRRRPAPPRPSRQETDEEKMRRFMEALGLPAETPPPPVRQAPRPQPKPHPGQLGRPMGPGGGGQRPSQPMQRPQPLRPPVESQPRPEPVQPPVAVPGHLAAPARSVQETAPAMEVASLAPVQFNTPERVTESAAAGVASAGRLISPSISQRRAGGISQAILREQLGDPSAIRRAILLREILGTPKGLQSASGTSIFSPL